MWFEILPSFGIVWAALALPHVANYWINKGFTGNAYRRNIEDVENRQFYRRDVRLTGNPYRPNGLDSIPDA